jgi:uncharacterized protein YdeI (YjbR/CyaY-like superfamily)
VSEPIFFATPADFRAWLEQHGASTDELVVGFWKTATGRPSMTWPESVEEALCFGWIDGIRRSLDADSYTIRFTPRRARSIWSKVNVATYARLVEQGRMTEAGTAAWERRRDHLTGVYSAEQEELELPAEVEAALRAAPGAWEFWSAQPPSYRKSATWWLVSAKKAETRKKRLDELVADSAAGLRIKLLRRG